MFDLNAIVNAAIATAVAEAIKPLTERLAALEKNEEYLTNRIAALEGVDHERQHAMTARWFGGAREEIDALTTRVVALENNPAQGVDTQATPVVIDEARMVEALNSQEWFWEKLQNRIDAATEAAMDDHTGTYDHDDYDSHIGDDDKHFDGDIEDAVRDALSNMSFDISIR